MYIFILRKRGFYDDIHKYLEECREHEDKIQTYSFYVHGFLLPWFQEQREAGKIAIGMKSKPLFFDGAEWDYHGELDKNGNACGWGKATQRTFSKIERIFEGSFIDNHGHGYGFLTEKEKNETE